MAAAVQSSCIASRGVLMDAPLPTTEPAQVRRRDREAAGGRWTCYAVEQRTSGVLREISAAGQSSWTRPLILLVKMVQRPLQIIGWVRWDILWVFTHDDSGYWTLPKAAGALTHYRFLWFRRYMRLGSGDLRSRICRPILASTSILGPLGCGPLLSGLDAWQAAVRRYRRGRERPPHSPDAFSLGH